MVEEKKMSPCFANRISQEVANVNLAVNLLAKS